MTCTRHHRAPKEHELKCWPEFYEHVVTGVKAFEIRNDDGRDFMATDTLWLREWHAVERIYTGRECRVLVTYLLGGHWPGLEHGYVVMSIARVRPA